MKTFFIHAKLEHDTKLTDEALNKLPKQRYGLVTSIQHMHKIRDVQEQLGGSIFGGQLLGCRADAGERVNEKVDAFLFVGTGVFHPIQLALKTQKDVWLWDPVEKILKKLEKKQIDAYVKRKNASLSKFFASDNIGIIITTKIGQNENKIMKFTEGIKLTYARKLETLYSEKKYYYFACDTLSQYDLENFPFIQCWVNTACNRIVDEKSNIVNMEDILEFKKNEQP